MGEVTSSCHVSVKLEEFIEEEVRRFKICKNLILNDLVFNKERFGSLLAFEKVG